MRWDPSESTIAKAEAIVKAEGYSGTSLAADKSNYFEIVSTKYLGTTQNSQFQSYNQTTSEWGSRLADDGTFAPLETLNNETTNNANSEMPRAYHGNDGYGDLYNYYAATAENNKYGESAAETRDSLCPSGWILPSGGTGNKTYGNLLKNAYKLIRIDGNQTISNTMFPEAAEPTKEASKRMRITPLSISFVGGYTFTGGGLNGRHGFGYYWESETFSEIAARSLGFLCRHQSRFIFYIRCRYTLRQRIGKLLRLSPL